MSRSDANHRTGDEGARCALRTLRARTKVVHDGQVLTFRRLEPDGVTVTTEEGLSWTVSSQYDSLELAP